MNTEASLLRLSEDERSRLLDPLLRHLAAADTVGHRDWQGWRITRVDGGWSNLLYRATRDLDDLAIKFCMRDARDRAGREHGALRALHEAGLEVAPHPVLLDRTSYGQPVVVQTWLEGEVSAQPPSDDAGWLRLVEHFASIHALRPQNSTVSLPEAVVNANDPQQACSAVQQQAAYIAPRERPASLTDLLRRLELHRFASWPQALAALCRVDNNILNMVRRSRCWASVDWENAGWGDPAFDVAQWMTHASYVGVPQPRWEWVGERYASMVDDPTVAQRIGAYLPIVWVWWVARLARYLYEVPRGLDERLVPWPQGWQADLQAKYEHYLARAQTALATPTC